MRDIVGDTMGDDVGATAGSFNYGSISSAAVLIGKFVGLSVTTGFRSGVG